MTPSPRWRLHYPPARPIRPAFPPEVSEALAAFRSDSGPGRVLAAWRLATAVERWLRDKE